MNRTGLFLFIAVVILAVAAYFYMNQKPAGEATDATAVEAPVEGEAAPAEGEAAPAEEAPVEGEAAPMEEAPAEAPAEEAPAQ